MKTYRHICFALLPLLLASCFSSKSTSTYVLDCDFAPITSQQPRVIVKNVLVPGHLDSTQIMQRFSESRIGARKYQQWGINFRRMLKNSLTNKVAQASATPGTPVTVDILFNRFEPMNDQLMVDAVCILREKNNKFIRSDKIQFSLLWYDESDDTLIALYNQALDELTKRIIAIAQ